MTLGSIVEHPEITNKEGSSFNNPRNTYIIHLIIRRSIPPFDKIVIGFSWTHFPPQVIPYRCLLGKSQLPPVWKRIQSKNMNQAYFVQVKQTQGYCVVKGCGHLGILWRRNYGRESGAQRSRADWREKKSIMPLPAPWTDVHQEDARGSASPLPLLEWLWWHQADRQTTNVILVAHVHNMYNKSNKKVGWGWWGMGKNGVKIIKSGDIQY